MCCLSCPNMPNFVSNLQNADRHCAAELKALTTPSPSSSWDCKFFQNDSFSTGLSDWQETKYAIKQYSDMIVVSLDSDCVTYLLTYSLTHSFTYLLTYLFTYITSNVLFSECQLRHS